MDESSSSRDFSNLDKTSGCLKRVALFCCVLMMSCFGGTSVARAPDANAQEKGRALDMAAVQKVKITPVRRSKSDGFNHVIFKAADHYAVDAALIKAVIMAESSYNPRAVSKQGAKGLMQLMPRTARALGVKDAFNPAHNINGGVKYLRQLLDVFNENISLALAAYNAGTSKVKRHKGVPPIKATRHYIKKVMAYYHHYKKEIAEKSRKG